MAPKVKVYQIGLGSFGRHGFEKLVEMEKHLPEADLEIVGICDKDRERLMKAKRFARTHDTEVETFAKPREMYKHAEKHDERVMVYDASSTETHPRHIYESMQRGFYHLAEKPSSLKREDYIREKKLAQDKEVTWKVDFIERESPVVKKALELLEGEDIEKIEVFRENSAGVEKILNPINRLGVKGGDILDKMVHEVYTLDFIEKTGEDIDLELEHAETKYFMPKDIESQKLMSVDGGQTRSLDDDVATAMTQARLRSNDIVLELNSSWLGMSDKCLHHAKKIRERLNHEVFGRQFVEEDETAYLKEDARFFIIRGSRDMLGDMLNEKLYDLDTEEEIELRDYLHDQLYRVIEDTVLKAAGIKESEISKKETDIFMNEIFNIREKAVEEDDFRKELEKGKEKLQSLIIEDNKILENEESDKIAG